MKTILALVALFLLAQHVSAAGSCTTKTVAEQIFRNSTKNGLPELSRFKFQNVAPLCAVSKYYCPQQCQGHLVFEFYMATTTCDCPNNYAQAAIQPCIAPSTALNGGSTFYACVCPTTKICKRTAYCCSPQVDKKLDPKLFEFGGACTNCNPPANLTGDPHFVGFDGQPFEFNGFSGGIFNLISEQDHLVNALLDDFNLKGNTYIREVGFSYRNVTRIRFASSAVKCGLNGNEQVPLGVYVNDRLAYKSSATQGSGTSKVLELLGGVRVEISYEHKSRDVIRLYAPGIYMLIVKLYGSCHLDVSLNRHINPYSDGLMHGIVGQTMLWGNGEKGEFEGDETDYLVSGLFASDFTYNRFMTSGDFDSFYDRPELDARLALEMGGKQNAASKFTSQYLVNDASF